MLYGFRTHKAAGGFVYDNPGGGAGDEVSAFGIVHEEVPEEIQAVKAFVPGGEFNVVSPFGVAFEMDVHAGEHPCGVVHVELVVAEAQFAGGPVRYFLGEVHEGGGLQKERCVRAVAGDAYILTEFVSFPCYHRLSDFRV